MKLSQIPKLEVQEKSRLLSRKLSPLVFLLVFVVVSSIDTLKVNSKLELAVTATEPACNYRGSYQTSLQSNGTINKKQRLNIMKKRQNVRRRYATGRIKNPGISNTYTVNFSNGNNSGSSNPSFKGKNNRTIVGFCNS